MLIDGKKIAAELRQEIKLEISQLKNKYKKVPGLTVILVGDLPASQIYVRNKEKSAIEVGLKSEIIKYPKSVTEEEILNKVEELNKDNTVSGILVQLPLPEHINKKKVIEAISPDKDVDGFHPFNFGKMAQNMDSFIPATPYGIIELIDRYSIETEGKNTVVIGRSNIVGRPVSILASLKELGNATVTLCHSGTKDLKYFSKQADVLVAALGSPQFVDSSYIKEGACLVDVGINRIEVDGKSKIVGDVNQDSVTGIASSLTPVPKGVGPMTIAMLVENTVLSAELLLN